MPEERIKFIISQDGTVKEEVQGAKSKECIHITIPFEEALGSLDSRQYKPEYYVTSQYNQDKVKREATINTGTFSDGGTS